MPLVEQLVQDLRYGMRGLNNSRAFLATTVLTLAVGLGLLAVAFTVVNAYVLRPYAVRDPEQLHQIGWRSRDGGGQSFRWRDYEELRARTDLFTAVIAENTRFVSSNGRPRAAALVSDNYFDALGPAVFMGRTWRTDQGSVEGVVLSHQAWTRLFVWRRHRHDPGRCRHQRAAFRGAGHPAARVHWPERYAARRLDAVPNLRRAGESRAARSRAAAGAGGIRPVDAGSHRRPGAGGVCSTGGIRSRDNGRAGGDRLSRLAAGAESHPRESVRGAESRRLSKTGEPGSR